MAINFKFGKNNTVNITIKDHAIRFIELKQTQPLAIQRMGEHYLPNGLIKEGKIVEFDTLETILEQCVSDWKIAKRTSRFIVPDPFVVMRKIAIPKDIQDDEINGYLYMELGTTIHLPFEEPVFDFFSLADKGNETNESTKELLLFAAPENNVKEYMNLLEAAKLKPIAADISSLALNRLIHQVSPVNSKNQYLLVQIDLQSINICIFENNIPIIMRHLQMDVDREKWSDSRNRDSSISFQYSGDRQEVFHSLKDMYHEIEKVMNYFQYSLNQGKQQVQNIILDGDHPWLADIFEQMTDRFAVPVIKMEDIFAKNKETESVPCQFHLNIGLGLKEV